MCYYLPKLYKNKVPISISSVVSIVNSMLYTLGKWIIRILKQLLSKVSTNLKYSVDFIRKIKNRKYSRLWISLCNQYNSNVFKCRQRERNNGIISVFLCMFTNKRNLLIKQLLLELRRLVRNNVFRFYSTFWRQDKRTTIGVLPDLV